MPPWVSKPKRMCLLIPLEPSLFTLHTSSLPHCKKLYKDSRCIILRLENRSKNCLNNPNLMNMWRSMFEKMGIFPVRFNWLWSKIRPEAALPKIKDMYSQDGHIKNLQYPSSNKISSPHTSFSFLILIKKLVKNRSKNSKQETQTFSQVFHLLIKFLKNLTYKASKSNCRPTPKWSSIWNKPTKYKSYHGIKTKNKC